MNALNEITGDEFVRFLQSLEVETYKLSFEWMLNDPEFAGVLNWMYNSLDHNNALTAREEYRYNELLKKDALLSPDELEAAITSIQDQYPGICLPGDQRAKEEVELDIHFQEERLAALEKQEAVVKQLITQNEEIKEQLTLELVKLNTSHRRSVEDEEAAAEECTTLAWEIEELKEEVIHVIADNLDVYANCKADKDTAKQFVTFSPIESYRQSMALLRSHHDRYVTKHLGASLNTITKELRDVAATAKSLEQKLSDAALLYIKSKTDLSGEQAKLALLSKNYSVQPSQITNCLLEAQSALELLVQEENIAESRAHSEVEQLVRSRTELAVGMATAACLEVRLHIQACVSHLSDVWHQALALDRILYYALRRELHVLEEFLQFAADFRTYALTEARAVATRMELMNEICSEHESSVQKLQSINPLLQTLCTLLGLSFTTDPSLLVKAYNNLRGNLRELEQNVEEGFRKKEDDLIKFKNSTKPLKEYIWSGSTNQVQWRERAAAALAHALRHQVEAVDREVLKASELYTRVKSGDKNNMRKLWQWFLTDQPRFLAAMKNCTF